MVSHTTENWEPIVISQPKTNEIILSFDSNEALREWMSWYDNAGEQEYYEHLDMQGLNND